VSQYTKAAFWCEPFDGGFKTTDWLSWHIGRVDSGQRLTVPPGFYFDVSVPFLLHWLFDPHDPRYLKAAALHDWGLCDGWDRRTIGAIFHEALLADGVPAWRRLLMWLAVSVRRYS